MASPTPYFKFEPAIHGEYGIARYPELPPDISFLAGRAISEPLPRPLVFSVSNPADVPPQHLVGTMIPVASQALLDALQAAGVDTLQRFAAVLRNDVTGQCWTDFFAFNLLGLVDAVEGRASPSEPLVLAQAKVAPHRMFRAAHNPLEVFISEGVRSELIRRRPPEGWGVTTTEVPVR